MSVLSSSPALHEEVRSLARAREAVILAHNYQRPEVQDVADYVGDSLGLARFAAASAAPVIALCGVHFMAETAAILCPGRTVLIPDPKAGSEERVLVAEEQRALWAALRTLDPRCQALLRIVAFVSRPDYDLVAERLGMRRGSVGPTRLRCLDKLRLALRGEHGRKEGWN